MNNLYLWSDSQEKINTIIQWGCDNLHLLADFDKTLTHEYNTWRKVGSIMALLRDNDYLGKEYAQKAHALYDHYSIIEKDMSLPFDQRKAAMLERRTKHYDVLQEHNLHKNHVTQAIVDAHLLLRKGTEELLSLLNQKHIPLIIISANWLGTDSIRLLLEQQNSMSENISLISNELIRNEDGYMIGAKEPIIHGMNKDETVLHDLPIYQEILTRKNIILLGDSPNDPQMAHGANYDTLLKVWFFNHDPDDEKYTETYQQFIDIYDIVITNDWPMNAITDIITRTVNS